MKFEQWFKNEVYNIERFYKYWEKEHKKNPEIFPMQMDSGDWNEQFDLFCEEFSIKETE